MEGIKEDMNGRNLKEGQWEDREQWSIGVGQRRKTLQNRRWWLERTVVLLVIMRTL
jgi:hypothetical protein